jgi:hypothetical protein
MMDVDESASLRVAKRRQLVHPGSIVTLLVRLVLDRLPARMNQSPFDLREGFSWHHDVDVANQTTLRDRQPRGHVGRTLE